METLETNGRGFRGNEGCARPCGKRAAELRGRGCAALSQPVNHSVEVTGRQILPIARRNAAVKRGLPFGLRLRGPPLSGTPSSSDNAKGAKDSISAPGSRKGAAMPGETGSSLPPHRVQRCRYGQQILSQGSARADGKR